MQHGEVTIRRGFSMNNKIPNRIRLNISHHFWRAVKKRLICYFTSAVFLVVAVSGFANSESSFIIEASLAELQSALIEGDITSQQLVQNYLDRIAAYDQQGPSINAIIRINPAALERAKQLDSERQSQGPRGPLHGIPIIVKDNFNTADIPTSSGSVALASFMPAEDAFHVQRLRASGAVILAKANMDEWAAGIQGLSSLGGQTKNPYDLSRTPGGSSGGTAAAVAAGFAAAGMGTDTCSSIRLPASFNHLVGLRPTNDLSSNQGVVPLIGLMDVAGPIAKSTADIALIMDTIVSERPEVEQEVKGQNTMRFTAQLNTVDLSALRLGKLNSLYGSDKQSPVNAVIKDTEAFLVKQGVTFVDIDSSWLESLYKEYNVKPPFQFKPEMEAYFKANPDSGFQSIDTIIEQGIYHRFHDERGLKHENFLQEKASPEVTRLRQSWQSTFRDVIRHVLERHKLDAFIYPTSSLTPVKLQEHQAGSNCLLSAISGAPSITLPAGFTDKGLPVGLELLGPAYGDERLVAVSHAIESSLGPRKPPPTTPGLVNGKAPSPKSWTVNIENKVEVRFRYQPLLNELAYETRYLTQRDVYAVCLHRSKTGPIIHCVSGLNKRRMNGVIGLLPKDIESLKNQAFYLRLYDAESPKGKALKRVSFSAL